MEDHVIVGGGTAGCVLARRLTDAGHKVLLIEAGPAFSGTALPGDIRSLYPAAASNPAYLWPDLSCEYVAGKGFHPYPQGRLLGGTSMIMGLMALRGLPRDYEHWEAMGARGWNWRAVRPYFDAMEAEGSQRRIDGRPSGPLSIRTEDPARWNSLAKQLEKSCARMGWRRVDDFNRDHRDGYGPLPMSRGLDERCCAGTAYLTAATLRSPLLQIRSQTHALRLELELGSGRCRVAALWVRHADGSEHRIAARRIVMTAGALHTPAVLMRSGIGDPGELSRCGNETRVESLGLGANLQTHALYNLFTFVGRDAREYRPDWPPRCELPALELMPAVPAANTHLPVIMVAEKIAHAILSEGYAHPGAMA